LNVVVVERPGDLTEEFGDVDDGVFGFCWRKR
jgi:hypothetical protein